MYCKTCGIDKLITEMKGHNKNGKWYIGHICKKCHYQSTRITGLFHNHVVELSTYKPIEKETLDYLDKINKRGGWVDEIDAYILASHYIEYFDEPWITQNFDMETELTFMKWRLENAVVKEKKEYVKICKWCKIVFTTKNNGKRFCSYECEELHIEKTRKKKEKIRVCVWCGKEFPGKDKSKCCSINCRDEYSKEYRKKYYSGPEKPIIKCVICGNEFQQKQSNNKCCSKECIKEYNSIYYKNRRKMKPLKKECVICGNPFETNRVNRITCSDECARKNHINKVVARYNSDICENRRLRREQYEKKKRK